MTRHMIRNSTSLNSARQTNSPGWSRARTRKTCEVSGTGRSHRRGEAVLADIDAGRFNAAVGQLGAGGDENLRARHQVALVAVDELHDRGVVRHRDHLLALLVLHGEHRAVD